MVLVFSDAANNSDEIKKELSLASRYHVPVMALRIEDVEPSDAFAYELSTRQWIDAFAGWDKSIDALVGSIGNISAAGAGCDAAARRPAAATRSAPARAWRLLLAAAALCCCSRSAAAWWFLRRARRGAQHDGSPDRLPAPVAGLARNHAGHGARRDHRRVRRPGRCRRFDRLSPGARAAPAYALGGTIQRDGDQIRVITRLTNERSGATLWSSSFNYAADQVSRVPRHIAVDAGEWCAAACSALRPIASRCLTPCSRTTCNIARRPLSSRRTPARPRFRAQGRRRGSRFLMGMVGGGRCGRSKPVSLTTRAHGARSCGKSGSRPRRRRSRSNSRNSEALAQKSVLIEANDLVGQERLLKQAIAARPLDCGCEHHLYGMMLRECRTVCRAVPQFRRATEMLALDCNPSSLWRTRLTVIGKPDEAKPHFDAAVDLSPDPDFAAQTAVIEATETGDYVAGIKALNSEASHIAATRQPLLAGFQAMASGDPGAKARAVKGLVALPDDQKNYLVVRTLAVLGANHEAFDIFVSGCRAAGLAVGALVPQHAGRAERSGFPASPKVWA